MAGAAPAFHPALLFFVLSVTWGTIIAALTPPLRGPDEAAHVLRAYGIAQGDIIPSQVDAQGRKGIILTRDFFRQFTELEARYAQERTPFRPTDTDAATQKSEAASQGMFVPYGGSEGYAPAAYLPHVAAALVARSIGLDFVGTLYLMRLTGLVTLTLAIAYAILLVPTLGWGFMATAMLPAALYGRTVVNADGGALAFAMVAAALCLRSPSMPTRLRDAGWMTLCVLSKPPNLAFVLLAALRTPVVGLARHWRSFTLLAAPGLVAAFAWTAVSAGDAGSWRLVILTGRPLEQFDPIWKLRYMMAEPLRFPAAVMASLSDPGELWWQLIGVLGLFDTTLHPWAYPTLTITLVVSCLARIEASPRTRNRVAIVAALAATGYAVAVFAIFYMVWTPIDADQVWGVQGRYFIPALVPVAIVLGCLLPGSVSESWRANSAIVGSVLSGLACIEAIWRVEWSG
jgi:uncharacterized membrane protein